MKKRLIIIKGAGDLATGAAHRLNRCGFSVLMLEMAQPTVIRRTVAFAEAIYAGEIKVEGVSGAKATHFDDIEFILAAGKVAVLADPAWQSLCRFRPFALVDAIMAKNNLGTSICDAPVTVGLGPGFEAGVDVHAVVETQRGHNLGRVLYQGRAEENTGVPGRIGGYTVERLLRAPAAGEFLPIKEIGDCVAAGETVALVGSRELTAPIAGVVRGMLKTGLYVTENFKVGDIDPRAKREHCFTISDKARAVAGGVLEAVLHCAQGVVYGSDTGG